MSAIVGDETPFNVFGVIKCLLLIFIEGGGNTVARYGLVDGYFNKFDVTSFALMSVMSNTTMYLLLVFDQNKIG